MNYLGLEYDSKKSYKIDLEISGITSKYTIWRSQF